MIARFVAALLGSAQLLLPCSCVSVDICDRSQSADAVFVGVAESDEIVRVRGVAKRVFTFAISENLRGESPERARVATIPDELSCGAEFTRSVRYLVFAKSVDGRLETNLCAGNRPLDQAAAAVRYLREARRTGSRPSYLFGNVTNRFADARAGLGFAPAWPVSGVRVRATGMGISASVVSRKDGSFEFFNLAPGSYRIEAGEAGDFAALPDSTARVAEGSCSEVHLARRRFVDLHVRAAYSEGALILEPEGVGMNRPGARDPELAAQLSGGIATFSVPPGRYRLALERFGRSEKLYHGETLEIKEGTPVKVEFRAAR